MDGNPQDALIIFVKYPRPGRVKTRLACGVVQGDVSSSLHANCTRAYQARGIGDEAAAAFYREMARGIVQRMATDDRWRTTIAFALEDEEDATQEEALIREWLEDFRFDCIAQHGDDLGERMGAAFTNTFANGARRVVLMGSDCPDATPDDIATLLSALDQHDVAIAPCNDGGYWAIALRPDSPTPFDGVAWSTDNVLRQTRELIAQADASLAEVCPHNDIDDVEDYRRHMDSLESEESAH